jgi:hypothetical protein
MAKGAQRVKLFKPGYFYFYAGLGGGPGAKFPNYDYH